MNLNLILQWKDHLNGKYYDRRVLVDTEGMIPDIGQEITFDGPARDGEHCVKIERIKHGTSYQESAATPHDKLHIGPSVLVSPVTEEDAEAMRKSWRNVIDKAFHFHYPIC